MLVILAIRHFVICFVSRSVDLVPRCSASGIASRFQNSRGKRLGTPKRVVRASLGRKLTEPTFQFNKTHLAEIREESVIIFI